MDILEFASEVGKLKEVDRTGWKIRGVKNPESVSDHSFRVAILVMLYSKSPLDREKCLKMALIHDLSEIYIGDIPTRLKEEDKVISDEEKVRLEKEGFKKLFKKLPKDHKEELKSIWEEFLEQRTEEAKFVNDMDKIEMLLQCLEYKKSGLIKDCEEFFLTAEKRLKTRIGLKLFRVLKGKSRG